LYRDKVVGVFVRFSCAASVQGRDQQYQQSNRHHRVEDAVSGNKSALYAPRHERRETLPEFPGESALKVCVLVRVNLSHLTSITNPYITHVLIFSGRQLFKPRLMDYPNDSMILAI
jgi:hypothetical protein